MSYDYSTGFEESLGLGIAFWLIYILVVFGLSIAMYVLRAAGMYSIAKRRGIDHPWMAWVPVVDLWLLGCISDQYRYVVKGQNKSKRKALLILNIIMAVLYIVFLVLWVGIVVNAVTGVMSGISEEEMVNSLLTSMMGLLAMCIPLMGVAIAVMVIRYMAMYDLYTSCSPQNNVLFLVLSIFFSVTEPFFIFCNRKKDGGMPPRRAEPQPQYIPPQEPWENSEP